MTKFSGRYCLEKDQDGNLYCIPVELKKQFDELVQNIEKVLWNHTKELEQLELFNLKFSNYYLEKPLSQYSFTDFQEME